MFAAICLKGRPLMFALAAAALVSVAAPASAQRYFRGTRTSGYRGVQQAPIQNFPRGYFASIAYSQSTGKIGYSARQSRSKETSDALALRMCGEEDAKVWMWARDQWVAIAIVEGHVGTAGFGRGDTADEAQAKALSECAKRAHGRACRVALCIHSAGMRVRELRSIAAEPIKSRTGYFAALAFSPSTGKIGKTAGKAKTIDAAKELALKDCGEEDAKIFMWGDQWIAIAVSPKKAGVAGFAPGETREEAEKVALAQATKFAGGAAVELALAIHSTGLDDPPLAPVAQPESPATADESEESTRGRERRVARPVR